MAENEQTGYKLRAKAIIQSYGFIANEAHCAVEAKPPVEWNKGQAALYILRREFGEDWPNKVKVIFAGDDTTDEDAMKVTNPLRSLILSLEKSLFPICMCECRR